MKINISKIIIFIFVGFFLLIFWLGLKKDNNYDTKNIIGNKIDSFQLSSIYSNKFISEEILKENKFTLINFFASWCAPCRAEHEYLLNLSKRVDTFTNLEGFDNGSVNSLNILILSHVGSATNNLFL